MLHTGEEALIRKLPAATQKRMTWLMDRNNDGLLTADELAELEALAMQAHELSIENARRLTDHRQHPVPSSDLTATSR